MRPHPRLRLYSALSRLPHPRSYGGKLLLVAALGVLTPLAALVAFVAGTGGDWMGAATTLGLVLAATLVATVVTLALLHRLLAPVALSHEALREYLTRHEIVPLPTGYADEAGVLMADTRHAIGRLDEMLQHLAGYDPGTGLVNRTLFVERLREAAARSRRTGRPFAVLTLDLDGFQAINDRLGATAGDEILLAVAQRLPEALRGGDVLARVDGDEFAVLATDHGTTASVIAFARRQLEALRRPMSAGGQDVRVTASVGVALYPVDGEEPDTLLAHAGAAGRAARQTGGDAYRFYGGALNAGLDRRLLLEADLPGAIERGELRVYFQPKVRLADGTVTSVEALARWAHPALGLVPPAEFIPVAEGAGIIGAIGEWVLRTACEQIVAWDAAGLPTLGVAVNLSPRQMARDGAAASVLATVAAAGLDPRRLEIEITEGVLLENERHATEVLGALRAAGVTVALDDFGTGYSSLAYLHRLPVDVVKIDRQFVRGLPDDLGSDSIVAAVIALARALGLGVVAEGVETEAQRQRLTERGCDVAQGYLFGTPLPAAEFAAALAGADAARSAPHAGVAGAARAWGRRLRQQRGG